MRYWTRDWEVRRWCRNSAVFTLTILGFSAICTRLDSADVKATLALAIALLAFDRLDLSIGPLDKFLRELAPVLLVVGACLSILLSILGDERYTLVQLLKLLVVCFVSMFGIQLMTWNTLKKSRMFRKT